MMMDVMKYRRVRMSNVYTHCSHLRVPLNHHQHYEPLWYSGIPSPSWSPFRWWSHSRPLQWSSFIPVIDGSFGVVQFRNLAPSRLVILLLVIFVVVPLHLNNFFPWSSMHLSIMFSVTLCRSSPSPTLLAYLGLATWSHDPASRAFTSVPQKTRLTKWVTITNAPPFFLTEIFTFVSLLMTQLSSSSPVNMTWTAATWVQSGPCFHLRCTWRSSLSHRSQSSATSSSAFLRREDISLPHWPARFVRPRVHDDVTDSKTRPALLPVHRIHLHPFLGLASLEATRRAGSVLTVFHLNDVHDLLLLLLSIVHLKHLEPVLCHTRLTNLSPRLLRTTWLASPVVMFIRRLNSFAEDSLMKFRSCSLNSDWIWSCLFLANSSSTVFNSRPTFGSQRWSSSATWRSTPRSPWSCRRRPSSSFSCRDSRTSSTPPFSAKTWTCLVSVSSAWTKQPLR